MDPRRALLSLPILALLAGAAARARPVVEQEPPAREPIDIRMEEEAEVRRLFIDVLAVDRDGRPMPGLTKEDFKIRLDYLWRKIYSVDDLCPCEVDASGAVSVVRESTHEGSIRLAEVDTRYILYFDFSQLTPAGRHEAIAQARRWVEEAMRPDDRAMVVAHATEVGLKEFSPFTSDREGLLRAIDRIAEEPGLVDPFPSLLPSRIEMCRDGTLGCSQLGRRDYLQMRRSLRAMLGFLTRMDSVPGRKALLLFHENMTLFPGRLYDPSGPGQDLPSPPTAFSPDLSHGPLPPRRRPIEVAYVPDVLELAGEVGAAATSSRTAIYPLVAGWSRGWTANFGANLADFSGGEHNRGSTDLAAVLDGAGRECQCIYRIGVEPPSAKSRIYRTKVKVRGRALPSRYRIHYLTRRDRWARRATAVLTNPEDAWGLEIDAALVPRAVENGRWTLDVQVALDLETLESASIDGRPEWEWEVGVLLAELESRKVREMLGVSTARREAATAGGSWVVHERTFEDLKPGEYEVRAFVRDRTADVYGGARAKLELPSPKRGGVAGPLVLRRRGPHRVASLPLRENWDSIDWMDAAPVDGAWSPLGLREQRPGDPLLFLSWVCPAGTETSLPSVRRYIARSDEPPIELREGEANEEGRCARWVDRLDTGALRAGAYEYLVGPVSPGDDSLTAAAPFKIKTGF